MNDHEDQSPFGRGFVAACIVIAAVLLCGALLLITGLTSDPSSTATAAEAGESSSAAASAAPWETGSAPATPGSDPVTPGSGSDPATPGSGSDPATPGSGSDPAAPGSGSDPATPATEPGPGSSGQPTRPAGGCSLPAGDQAVPTKPPLFDGWDVSRHVVVPRSSTYGPAITDADGFRHCFAHSPTGAVYAAYNAIAAISDQRQAILTVRKLMVPGPDSDALIRELKTEDPSGSATPQLAGFRVLDSGPDRVTVMLALPVQSAYMSATLTLVWHDNDWRLRPPSPGQPIGAPFAQHRDLADFIRWNGI